jgi:Na+/melibiose symporter-like transporter
MIIQTRYARVVDRIRIINAERLELVKALAMNDISDIETVWNENRMEDLESQISILLRRGKLLKNALQFMFLSVFTSIISSLLLFIQYMVGTSMTLPIIALFSVGMVLIFMGSICTLKEMGKSFAAAVLDTKTLERRKGQP